MPSVTPAYASRYRLVEFDAEPDCDIRLEKLYLGGNELTGPIPQALSHLVQADGEGNNRGTGGDARIDPFATDPLGLIGLFANGWGVGDLPGGFGIHQK